MTITYEQLYNEFKTQLENGKRNIKDEDLTRALALKYMGVKLNDIAKILNEKYKNSDDVKINFTKSSLSKFLKRIETNYKSEDFVLNAKTIAKESVEKNKKPKAVKKVVAKKEEKNVEIKPAPAGGSTPAPVPRFGQSLHQNTK